VTECYLEPLAAIWQSMRITSSGQGWRRFLVFAELTKSKKGANYIALFTYFQFKSALLIIVAQGPRVAINAMTLYAVMQAQLIPVGEHASKDHSNFVQFFMNIKFMVEKGNRQETIIYFTMLFSLIIWVIAALGLIISGLFYVLFLWSYIPTSDGSLSRYCRRKVETRLERIVGKKVKKAIEKADQKRREEERRAIKKGNLDPAKTRPTLPKLEGDDDTPTIVSMQRSDTMSTNTTLPSYASNALSRTTTMATNRTMGRPLLPTLEERPAMPTRSNTQFTDFSNGSYRSNAPLLDQAGGMSDATPLDPLHPLDRNGDYSNNFPPRSQPGRSFTPASQGRASPFQPGGPLPPVDTSYSTHRFESDPQLVSPLASSAQSTRPYPEFSPYDSRGPAPGQSYELSPVDTASSIDNDFQLDYYMNSNSPENDKPPPLPNVLQAGASGFQQRPGPPSAMPQPMGIPRAGTAPPRPGLPASLQSAIQRREASQPLPNRGMAGSVQQQRSATAPIQQPGWSQGPPNRMYTPMDRSYTPAERSYTPVDRTYTPLNRSYDPADRSNTPSSQPAYNQGYTQGYQQNHY
jgi:hypothetical protein